MIYGSDISGWGNYGELVSCLSAGLDAEPSTIACVSVLLCYCVIVLVCPSISYFWSLYDESYERKFGSVNALQEIR